ncbi:MAG: isoaspartyl peptidase/L-asparaginase [Owenweeksia sp.]|nr:isoaspartyl peptidase/L-asparaginase [Owenweeksia sp.]
MPEAVIDQLLKPAGGSGGLVGVDKDGNIVMSFNTSGMFRASVKEGAEMRVAMFAKK